MRTLNRAPRWKSRYVSTLALAAALALLSARADEAAGTVPAGPSVAGIPLSGRIYADTYVPIKNTDTNPYPFMGASFWLQADPKLNEKSSGRVILQSEYYDTTVTGKRADTVIREGYVTYSDSGWEARFGKQIIPWGKSDAVNPTDLISAKDYVVLNPDEEVRRVGQTSLQINYTPNKGSSPLTLTGILTPVFAQSVLLFNPALVPAGVTVAAAPTTPPYTLSATEGALKASYAGSGWDASVMCFRGFNHMPEFYAVTPAVLGQTFHKVTATGGDFSFTWDKSIIRGETAYVWTENDDGTNPTIMPTHWDTVVGVERAFGSDFRLQVQGLWRFIPNFTAPNQLLGPNPLTTAQLQQLAAANALVLNYQDKSRAGLTARFGYANDQNGIDTEVFVIGNFIGGDYLIRPKFSYSFTDALKGTIGMDYYGGPTDRPLGQLQTFNSLFVEGKYSF